MEHQVPDGDEQTTTEIETETGTGMEHTNTVGGNGDAHGDDSASDRVEQNTTALDCEGSPLVDEDHQQHEPEEDNSSPDPSTIVSDNCNHDSSNDPPKSSAATTTTATAATTTTTTTGAVVDSASAISRTSQGRTHDSTLNEKIRSSSYVSSTSTVSGSDGVDGSGSSSFVAVRPGACAVAGPGITTTIETTTAEVEAVTSSATATLDNNRSIPSVVDPNNVDNNQPKSNHSASTNPTVVVSLPPDPHQPSVTTTTTTTDQTGREDSPTREMNDHLRNVNNNNNNNNSNNNNTTNDIEIGGVRESDVGDENDGTGNTAPGADANASSQRNRDVEDRDVPPENHPLSSTIPVAAVVHNDDDLPLISAELVLPPTTATPHHHQQQQQQQQEAVLTSTQPGHVGSVDMYHVDIDGDRSQVFHIGTDRQQYISDNNVVGYDIEETSRSGSIDAGGKDCNTDRRYRWIAFGVGVFLTVVGVVIAVVLSVTMGRDEATTTSTVTTTTTTVDGTVKNPSETFPYRCFSSTLDILSYQINAPEDEVMNDDNPIIICPNTFIRVGTYENPSADDFSISDGDYPIYIMRPNVTIQCGLDGKRSNNCTLAGGLLQVMTMYEYSNTDYGTLRPPPVMDGLTLRGLTFSGIIEGRFVYGGIPVTMSHPGKGNRFEDCAWVNLTASKRMIAVGRNYIMELRNVSIPELSVDLTVSNCLFEDNLYEEEFFVLFGQTLHLENTTFRNNRLPTVLTPGCGFHPNGCRNLIHAREGRNECSLKNVCVENFQTIGAGPIAISSTSKWSSSGINPWYGPVESTRENLVDETLERPFCELGVAKFDDDKQSYICLNETVFEYEETGGCP